MGKIYLPATSPEDWKQLLTAPEKQWKTGFSARALVHCWQATAAGEREVRKALRRTLFKYKLHTDAELFEKAYGYVREYY